MFAAPDLDGRKIGHRQVGSAGNTCLDFCALHALAAGEVGVDEFGTHCGRKVFGQLAGISTGKFKFVGLAGAERLAVVVGKIDVAQREITQAETHRLQILHFEVPGQISQINILQSQVAHPRRVGSRKTHAFFRKSQFGLVVVHAIGVGGGGNAHVAHTTPAGVGRNAEERHCRGHSVGAAFTRDGVVAVYTFSFNLGEQAVAG